MKKNKLFLKFKKDGENSSHPVENMHTNPYNQRQSTVTREEEKDNWKLGVSWY